MYIRANRNLGVREWCWDQCETTKLPTYLKWEQYKKTNFTVLVNRYCYLNGYMSTSEISLIFLSDDNNIKHFSNYKNIHKSYIIDPVFLFVEQKNLWPDKRFH